jgi:hypothetical protein
MEVNQKVVQLVTKLLAFYITIKAIITISQAFAIAPNPDPDQSSLHSHTQFL